MNAKIRNTRFVILELLVKQSLKLRLWSAFLPILFFLSCAELSDNYDDSSYAQKAKIDLIIKEGFVGKILIVNNLDCDVGLRIDNRAEVLVPENGVIHSMETQGVSKFRFRVLEKNEKGELEELNWHQLSEGEKGIIVEGRSSVEVDGENYAVSLIEIGEKLSLDMRITDRQMEAIAQYIRDCKRN